MPGGRSKMKDNLRTAMGRFATGVSVVTTKNGDEINGMTANALTSVSLEPPLILICVDRDNYTHRLVSESKIFAVNILSESQQELADAFARPGPGKADYLSKLETFKAITGSPIIANCLSYLDCRVVQMHQAGDHTIFIGQVTAAEVKSDNNPLIYWNGSYRRLG